MYKHASTENAQNRQHRRRRSGVRAAAAASGVLLLAFFVYWSAGKILIYLAERSWSQKFTTAIQQGESKEIAELLKKCRSQAPYLQDRKSFLQWENELQKLRKIEAFRRARFRERLTALQEKLKKNQDENHSWADELISAAAYASTEQELAEVRSLEAHCKAREKLRTIKAAQVAVKDIEKLADDIKVLDKLCRCHRWQEFARLQKQITGSIAENMVKYPTIPEYSWRTVQLQKEFNAIEQRAQTLQKQAQKELQDFHKIFAVTDQNRIAGKIREFKQKHPASKYIAQLEILLKDMEIFSVSYQNRLRKIEKIMAKNNETAKKIFQSKLEKIIEKELQYGSFELILRTNENRIVRFETLSKCFFVRQKDNSRRISFTTVDNRQINGVFTADGNGAVYTPHGKYTGVMIHGKPEGVLPESCKQQTLLKAQQMLKSYSDEDFPVFLYFLQQQLKSGKLFLLPLPVKIDLQSAMIATEKALNAPVDQFIFTREIIAQCRANTPVFAGLLQYNGKTPEFSPAAAALNSKKTTTLWVVDSQKKPYFFEFGKLQNSELKKPYSSLLEHERIYVAAIPENGADYASYLANMLKTARKNQLVMPPLPDFLHTIKALKKY